MIKLDFEKIKHLFPYFGSLIIVCGFIKLKIYYNHFNINISDYLDITEVLILLLYDFIYYGTFITSTFFVFFLLDSKEDVEKNENKKSLLIDTDDFYKRLYMYMKLNFGSTILLIVSLILLIAKYFFDIKNSLPILPIFIAYFFLYLLFEYRRKYKIFNGNDLDGTYNNLILILFIFTYNIIQSAYTDIDIAENNNKTIVCFNYRERDIQSEKNIIYIGQTKNYIFMFDKISRETNIYLRSDIKNLTIGKKNI